MTRPNRRVLETAQEAATPPADLAPGQAIARVASLAGKNLYNLETAQGEAVLAELPARFRSAIWIKRGGYVVVDRNAFADRENRLGGEIVNVVRDEKQWRKESYWPAEFVKKATMAEDSDEESNVGKMPPSEGSEDDA